MLPLMSGYRDKQTHTVMFTTFYLELYGKGIWQRPQGRPSPFPRRWTIFARRISSPSYPGIASSLAACLIEGLSGISEASDGQTADPRHRTNV